MLKRLFYFIKEKHFSILLDAFVSINLFFAFEKNPILNFKLVTHFLNNEKKTRIYKQKKQKVVFKKYKRKEEETFFIVCLVI